MNNKITLKIQCDGDSFYRYMDTVAKVRDKFKLNRFETNPILDELFELKRIADMQNTDINSIHILEQAVGILRTNLSDFIDFKTWNEENQNWQTI